MHDFAADILVVDGFPDTASTLRDVLAARASRPLTIVSAADGYEAVRLLRQGLPKVVLIDLELAGLFGYALARAVRRQPGGDQVTVFAMSSHQGRVSAAARSELFDTSFGRPLDLELLIERLPSDLMSA